MSWYSKVPRSRPFSRSRFRNFTTFFSSEGNTSAPGDGGYFDLVMRFPANMPRISALPIRNSHLATGNRSLMDAPFLSYSPTESGVSKYLFVFIISSILAIIVPSLVSTLTNWPLRTFSFSVMTKSKDVVLGPSIVDITVPSFM